MLACLSVGLICAAPSLSQADDSRPTEAPAAPAPYSLPWQLRPVGAATVVRSDTSFAALKDAAGNTGTNVATLLLGSYKLSPSFAPMLRLGFVSNAPPTGNSGSALINPVVGGTYSIKLSNELRLGVFLGLAIPVGQGGGDTPDATVAAATKAGVLARSAMDNAMFAVNDFTIFPGAGIAYIKYGLTVQAEATVLQLTRVRGAQIQKDSSRTNLTTGLHVGYFVIPQLSFGGELRMQRWLSTPVAVQADEALRDTFTAAIGARLHFKIGQGTTWLRPGLSYSRGLDAPMTRSSHQVIQLDVPVTF